MLGAPADASTDGSDASIDCLALLCRQRLDGTGLDRAGAIQPIQGVWQSQMCWSAGAPADAWRRSEIGRRGSACDATPSV